jgi:hypothetical protein
MAEVAHEKRFCVKIPHQVYPQFDMLSMKQTFLSKIGLVGQVCLLPEAGASRNAADRNDEPVGGS